VFIGLKLRNRCSVKDRSTLCLGVDDRGRESGVRDADTVNLLVSVRVLLTLQLLGDVDDCALLWMKYALLTVSE
jgi:hypothetical protein